MRKRKSSKPLVEFIHCSQGLEEYEPAPARRLRPEWWRQTPRTHPSTAEEDAKLGLIAGRTIRACPGIGDFLGLGYIVPLWTDVAITSDSTGASWEVAASDVSSMNEMPVYQSELMPLREGESPFSLKLNSPWLVKTPPGYSVLLMPLSYHRDPRFEVLPGVMDSDVLHKLRVIFKWNLCSDPRSKTILPAGLPVMQVIPFRRERYELSIEKNLERFVELEPHGILGVGRGAHRFVGRGYEMARRQFRRDNGLV